jgi:ubiquinone/menaquinone biosynthesis C-methylase UbiE
MENTKEMVDEITKSMTETIEKALPELVEKTVSSKLKEVADEQKEEIEEVKEEIKKFNLNMKKADKEENASFNKEAVVKIFKEVMNNNITTEKGFHDATERVLKTMTE